MKDNNKTKKQLVDELTELRLQNAALAKSESAEKYRGLVENIRDVIYELDSQGVVLYISPSVQDMLGFDSTEIMGKNFTKLAHKDDPSRLEEWFSELRKGVESPFEYRVSDKSGELRWVQTKTRPIMEDGVFKGARGILIDVTEQRKIVEALRESEEKYRLTFENVADVIYVIDANLDVLSVSPSVERILGYKPQDFIGRPVSDLARIFTAESFEQAIADTGLIFKGETIPATVYRFIAKDGTIKYGEVSGSPVMRDGKIIGLIAVARDITDRRRAEEALRKREAIYCLVVDNMADVITVMDLNLRFTYVSPSIIRLRGYTAEEVMSQTMEQVMTPESLQIVARVFEEELKLETSGTSDPGRTRILELEEYRKDGSTVWLESRMSALRDNEKKLIGIIALSRDITERRQKENMIKKQTDAMEAAMDGMALLNENEEYIYLNQAHAGIYGYENPGELIGKSWRTHYDADEIKRFGAEIMPKFSQKGYWQGEALGMKKDGSKFPQEISLTALDGGGLICVVRDITERKKTENEIQSLLAAVEEEKTKLSALINSITDEVWFADTKKRFTIVNPSALKHFCIEPNDIIEVERLAKSLAVLRPDGTERPAGEAPPLRALLGEVVTNLEETVRMPVSGEFRHRQVNAAPVRDTAGNIIGSVSIVRDITESKQAAEMLLTKTMLLEAQSETSIDGILAVDNEGRSILMNKRFGELWQIPQRILDEKDDAMMLEHILKQLKDPEEFNRKVEHLYEHYDEKSRDEIVFADGRTFDRYSSPLLNTKGRHLGRIWFFRDITDRKRTEDKLQRTLESLRKSFAASIQLMVSAVEARDPYTAGHQIRSADLARAIATEMGLPQEKIEGLRMAGSIHDIGKLSIPAEILSKPTKLTNIEFSLIKEHARIGYEMLKNVESPWPLAEIVYQHHERMDGSGYPRNLKGDEIIMEARIMAVADVVESMASHRPYRPSLGIDVALEEISKNRGILYDPEVADACLRLFNEKGYKLK